MIMKRIGTWLFFLFIFLFCTVALAKESTTRNGIRAIYYGNSIGTPGLIQGAIRLVERTELNAVVVNTKNDDGVVLLGKSGRDSIAELRARRIYVICRVVVFHDNSYGKAHPAAVLRSREYVEKHPEVNSANWVSNGKEFWRDGKGWIWIDPLDQGYRTYVFGVIAQSIEAGCNEVNLDYIRFPSPIDGKTSDILYPFWNDAYGSRCNSTEKFLASLRALLKEKYPHVVLSVDIFGYTFLGDSEERIGQCLNVFAKYVDVIAPMLYPSHFGCNDQHFKVIDPNTAPYAVYRVSLSEGLKKLRRAGAEVGIRPWLEAFDFRNICVDTQKGCAPGCGVIRMRYGERKNFRAQIEGCDDLRDPAIVGWMAWNPKYEYPHELFNSP